VTATKTLVCVHAHPDDESLFTAGITAHYAELGYQIILVTCTSGLLGIDDKNLPGSAAGHNREYVRATRAKELQDAAHLVGISRVVTLGYEDSGLPGWEQNSAPLAFMNCNVDAVGTTLAALFAEVGASVVVTYDENGFYGHPDHIMANRVTQNAVAKSPSVERLYYPVMPSDLMADFVSRATAENVSLPKWVTDASVDIDRSLVSTVMDVSRFSALKQKAIATHASQTDNADLVTMNPELFAMLFGTEFYQRAYSKTPSSADSADLFGGL